MKIGTRIQCALSGTIYTTLDLSPLMVRIDIPEGRLWVPRQNIGPGKDYTLCK